jgi:hypothetical protein
VNRIFESLNAAGAGLTQADLLEYKPSIPTRALCGAEIRPVR